MSLEEVSVMSQKSLACHAPAISCRRQGAHVEQACHTLRAKGTGSRAAMSRNPKARVHDLSAQGSLLVTHLQGIPQTGIGMLKCLTLRGALGFPQRTLYTSNP